MIQTLIADLEATLSTLEQAFRVLERKLPVPVLTSLGPRRYPRYQEKTADQAALQKIARYISGLHAIVILLKHRHLQEDGAVKRMLDELSDDIMFLIMRPQNEKEEALRARFLAAFYAETFEPGVPPMESGKRPKGLTRGEVRDYIHSRTGSLDAQGSRATQVIYQAYSGYVHSNSPHLMEMWDFDSMRFELDGSKDVDLHQSHVADAINYFARGFYNLAGLATALGEAALCRSLSAEGNHLAALAAQL